LYCGRAGKGTVLITVRSLEASVAPTHDLPVIHQACAGGRVDAAVTTRLRELKQIVQGLLCIAKSALGGQNCLPVTTTFLGYTLIQAPST